MFPETIKRISTALYKNETVRKALGILLMLYTKMCGHIKRKGVYVRVRVVCACTCACVYMRVCVHVLCVCACACVCTCACMYACVRARACVHVPVHVCIQFPFPKTLTRIYIALPYTPGISTYHPYIKSTNTTTLARHLLVAVAD